MDTRARRKTQAASSRAYPKRGGDREHLPGIPKSGVGRKQTPRPTEHAAEAANDLPSESVASI